MTDVSATVMPAQPIEPRMKRLRHRIYRLLPDMMPNLKLGPLIMCRNYGLYPKVMLNLKLDGE